MPDDDAGLTDEIVVELNPAPTEDSPGPDHIAMPPKPTKNSPISAWVDYCVGLGADRTYITHDTQHYVGVVTDPPLTKAQLIALATSLEG